MLVELTKDQCESLVEFIELNLLDVIRNDTDVDTLKTLVWLKYLLPFCQKSLRSMRVFATL